MELEQKIIEWANDRNLISGTTPANQIEKLQEEMGEVQEAIESGVSGDIMLELGDCYVVLVNLARKLGFSLEHCGWAAYGKIKDRKGKMIDGKFVKNI